MGENESLHGERSNLSPSLCALGQHLHMKLTDQSQLWVHGNTSAPIGKLAVASVNVKESIRGRGEVRSCLSFPVSIHKVIQGMWDNP